MQRTTLIDIPDRLYVKKLQTEGILSYDADNAYPQRVMDIIRGSATSFKCNEILTKFIFGQGFADKTFYKAQVNKLGQTTDIILRKSCSDLAMFRGLALHINYNANYQIVGVTSVPFEHCRLAVEKDSYIPHAVAVYDDWGRKRYKQIKKENIDFINFFNPDKVAEEVIAAGGWDKYKGQILYYSCDGHEYPTATADPVLEDCVTDGEIKLKKYRDVTTNFMASHIYINRGVFEDDNERTAMQDTLQSFQGSDNVGKIMMVESADEATDPRLLKVDIQNTDKLFEYTEQSVQTNIRKNYGLPSPLLENDIKAGFSTDLISECVNYYSYLTSDERLIIEEVYRQVFEKFVYEINPTNNYSILPLTYGINNI